MKGGYRPLSVVSINPDNCIQEHTMGNNANSTTEPNTHSWYARNTHTSWSKPPAKWISNYHLISQAWNTTHQKHKRRMPLVVVAILIQELERPPAKWISNYHLISQAWNTTQQKHKRGMPLVVVAILIQELERQICNKKRINGRILQVTLHSKQSHTLLTILCTYAPHTG